MIGIFTFVTVNFLKLSSPTGCLFYYCGITCMYTFLKNSYRVASWCKTVNFISSASHFARGIVMPNLKPPITTTAAAVAYRESILKALPSGSDFTPLMTLYLTDTTSPREIKLASKSNMWLSNAFYLCFKI